MEQELLKNILGEIEHYFNHTTIDSYDPTDIYEGSLGRLCKKLWKKKNKLYYIIAIPLQIMDILFPWFRIINKNIKKKSHPICYAQLGLAYINLAKVKGASTEQYMEQALSCFDALMTRKSHTNNGFGWGINIHWETVENYIPPNTPCHTQSSYMFEFVEQLYHKTAVPKYYDILESIADHTAYDYHENKHNEGEIVTGYSVLDNRVVINSMSYRALILLKAHIIFNKQDYSIKCRGALIYILNAQNKDGSWYYSEKEHFIDGYHTAFVLKNLLKIQDLSKKNNLFPDLIDQVGRSITKGYHYYIAMLFDQKGLPKPFSVTNKPCLYQYDAYDFAESLNVLLLIGDTAKINNILEFIKKRMLINKQGMRFRYYKYISRVMNGMTYNRYANSAFFLSLSSIISEAICDDEN